MTKSLLVAILILTFACVALFGFALMSDGHAYIMCPAEQMQGKECSAGTDPLALLSFHTGAFKAFTTAIFGTFVAQAYLIIFAAFLVLITVPISAPAQSSARLQYLNRVTFSIPAFKRLIRWLSLHENSPSYL